ncbi:MAG: DUF2007 domain-containing protein [Acidobacteriota bacterium]
MTQDQLVVARTFLNGVEAGFAQSVLEAAGIQAYVRADDCGGVEPGLQMGGVALIVNAADREEAVRVLDTTATVVDSEPA